MEARNTNGLCFGVCLKSFGLDVGVTTSPAATWFAQQAGDSA
jgi:hypothetical protein